MAEEVRDQRAAPRAVVNREFTSVEEFIVEYVRNVSRCGAFVRSEDPLPVGTRVQLRFTLILDELETVEGIGEVRRTVPPGGSGPSGMGVVFVELTEHSQHLLERLLTSPR